MRPDKETCLRLSRAAVRRHSTRPVVRMRTDMAFVRSLLQAFMQTQRKGQEGHDVWKLYNLLHHYERSGRKHVQVPRAPDVSYHEQYHVVHSSVTKQVYAL